MPKMTVSKLDAASAQVDTSIKLWFSDQDPISAHTLACSAYQIVHDINRQVGWEDLLYDSLVVKDEYRRMWVNTIKGPYNFFKHADKDMSETIQFDPDATEIFIMFTCKGLSLLKVKPSDDRTIFLTYTTLTKPDRLSEKGLAERAKYPEHLLQQAVQTPKADFYIAYMMTLSQMRDQSNPSRHGG